MNEAAAEARSSVGLVHSMTGFATMRIDSAESASFTMTLKSVNHRFFDLQIRLPWNSEALESSIRKLLKDRIHRGHVEFALQMDRPRLSGAAIDDQQLAGYVATFRAAARTHQLDCEPDLNEVLRLPGMMVSQQAGASVSSAEVQAAVLSELPELLARFNVARAEEGKALALELRTSMRRLEALAGEAGALRDGVRAANFDRLRTRIAELTSGLSLAGDRLLAEAALLADRSDIDEELVRLQTHSVSFLAMLEQGGALGKRLDFLLQEMNREANTLLSKTGGAASQNGLRITELGLEMKVEIERAKEQIQNLE